jgi:hypothetical protein
MTTWALMQVACEIFARHLSTKNDYMDQRCEFLGEHDVIYSGVGLDQIPVDSIDDHALTSFGWRPDEYRESWSLNT